MSQGYEYVSGTCPECGAATTARIVERRATGGTIRMPDRRRCTALGSCGWTEPQVPAVRMDHLRLSSER